MRNVCCAAAAVVLAVILAGCDGLFSTDTTVTGVAVTPVSVSLYVGESKNLIATITPSGATNKTVSWTSSNPAIASVSDTGTVKALSTGTAIVTVKTSDGNYSASCTIKVSSRVVSLDKSKLTLVKDESHAFTATITPSTTVFYTWTSSDDSVVLKIASETFTAMKAGKATITATADDSAKTKGTCEVTVLPGGYLVSGETTTGTLSATESARWHTFYGQVGSTYRITLTGNVNVTAYGDADGIETLKTAQTASFDITVSKSGTVYLKVAPEGMIYDTYTLKYVKQ